MTDTPAVRIRGLHKRYGNRTALAGIDLDIAFGEVVALLGPNGAGKTSTMEILTGHRSRDAGEVTVLGADPARMGRSGRAARSWRSGIGIVLQDVTDLSELTVGETVRHFARYYPAPRRLDVAVGLVGEPRLLFLDEPTAGFDPAARRGFWDLIRALVGSGTTILLTTHYLNEAEALADRVVVLTDGRVLADGTPAALAERADRQVTVRWAGGERRVHDPAPAGRPLPTRSRLRPMSRCADMVNALRAVSFSRQCCLSPLRITPVQTWGGRFDGHTPCGPVHQSQHRTGSGP